MNTRWLEQAMTYDGSQLRPHWIRRQAGIVGDALVAFRGPCAVTTDEMADVADLLDGPGIAGADMLHFVWEIFDDGDLERAVLRQRLFSAMALEALRRRAPDADLRREGDDLYCGAGKLSISVATRSLVSTLIHFAINVTNEGTPVNTAGLTDLGIEPAELAEELLAAAAREQASIVAARSQVRPRGGEAS